MIKITEQDIMKNWQGHKEKPKVSICCITYNHEKYIAETLESLLIQKTDFSFEIVIDDDCSTDKTAKIIQKYAAKFPNIIKAHLRKVNVGPYENSIGCLQRTKGEYIALCEGDDCWIDENKLQYQVSQMEKHDECDISFHPARLVIEECIPPYFAKQYIENNKSIISQENGQNIYARYSNQHKIFDTDKVILSGGGFCPTASIIIKKSIRLLLNSQENLHFAELGDYFAQVFGSVSGGALYVNKVMSTYRIHSKGIASSKMFDLSLDKDLFFRFKRNTESLDQFLRFEYHTSFVSFLKNQFQAIATYCDFSLMDSIMLYQEYFNVLSMEQKKDFLRRIKNELHTNSTPLEEDDINLIRDKAIKLQTTDLKFAHDLMLIAHWARPNGPFIKTKLEEYKHKLSSPGFNC